MNLYSIFPPAAFIVILKSRILLDIQLVKEYKRTSKETLKNIDDSTKMQPVLEVLINRIELLEKEK